MRQITLSQLVDQATEYLKNCAYSQHTIRHHSTIWNSFVKYSRKSGIQFFTLEIGLKFIVDHYGVSLESPSKHHLSIIRSIRMVDDIRLCGSAKKKYTCSSPEITRYHFKIYELYKQRQKERGLSGKTIFGKSSDFNKLLLFLENSGVTKISRLKPSDVYGYLQTLTSHAGTTLEKIIYTLRDALSFLVTEGFSDRKLADLFPVISTHSKDPVPSVYSVDEITTILDNVDREDRIGKRDYAILLLAARLGMRAGDIHRLRIDQIKWNNDSIEYVQQKTNQLIVLPLLRDVKLALLDYLKSSRFVSDLPHVFLTTNDPYTNGSEVEIYYRVIQKYLKLAHLEKNPVRKRGLHSLRHSLASNLLAQNTPMPVITGILGHKYSDTTSLYLKVDLNQLRLIALEVPHEER